MKFWLDTEFHERGHVFPVDFISIGLVSEDDREYTAVSSEFDWSAAQANPWLAEHVMPYLGPPSTWKLRQLIAREVIDFCGEDPEIWGYYADYDWVVVCQLFGSMIDLPAGWPMFCMDIKQWCIQLGNPRLPQQTGQEHEVLADARHHKVMWEFLRGFESVRGER